VRFKKSFVVLWVCILLFTAVGTAYAATYVHGRWNKNLDRWDWDKATYTGQYTGISNAKRGYNGLTTGSLVNHRIWMTVDGSSRRNLLYATTVDTRYLNQPQFNVFPKEVSLFKRVKGVAQW
jgi:hypothetical protein